MRGQFVTAGALRLLHFAVFVCVLSCHPIRNKMYAPLILAFWGVVFAIIDAAGGAGLDSRRHAGLLFCFSYGALHPECGDCQKKAQRENAKE